MTDEERRIITEFVERVSGAQQQQQRPASPWGSFGRPSAAPAQPPLPPVDYEADRMLADLFNRYPEARYRITQTAFVQEYALVEAQNRIQQLEWELENAQRQAHAQAAPQRSGMFGGMFGGGAAAQRPAPMPQRPQPQYPPGYNPQMLQQGRSGPGFLGTALMTAAGVAGGLVLGNAIMGMLGDGAAQAATGAADAAGTFAQEAVPSAWTDPGAAAASQGWGGSDAAPVDDASAYGDASADDASGGFDEEV